MEGTSLEDSALKLLFPKARLGLESSSSETYSCATIDNDEGEETSLLSDWLLPIKSILLGC